MRATVSSRLEYGLHLGVSSSQKARDNLQQVENEALRIVTGAAKATSSYALRHWLGVPSIRSRQMIQAGKELVRAVTTKSHPLREELMERKDQEIKQRLKTVRSWVIDSREMIELVAPLESIKPRPWIKTNCKMPELKWIGGRNWRERAVEMNVAEVECMLEELNPTLIVATDGSIREGITAWGGAVWRNRMVTFEWSAARHGQSSSFRAESEALEDALVWLTRNALPADHTVILTDSYSMVSKMEGGNILEWWAPLISRIPGRMTVAYIPRHAGIPFNEKADQLAGEATPIGDLVISPEDVIATVKKKVLEVEERNMPDHFSVTRLKESGTRRGDGAEVKLRGKDKRINTQTRMGVLSRSTLRELIADGGTCAETTSRCHDPRDD